MGRRMSDILRAKKLSDQLAGYIAYVSAPKTYTTPYKARLKRKPMMLTPFGDALETGKKALTSYEDKPENDAILTKVNDVAELVPKDDKAIQIIGFRPARVTRVSATTKTVTETKSKYTSVNYRKYNTDRASLPFGAKTAGDKFFDVADLLKTGLKEATLAICWVSFTPEGKAGR